MVLYGFEYLTPKLGKSTNFAMLVLAFEVNAFFLLYRYRDCWRRSVSLRKLILADPNALYTVWAGANDYLFGGATDPTGSVVEFIHGGDIALRNWRSEYHGS